VLLGVIYKLNSDTAYSDRITLSVVSVIMRLIRSRPTALWQCAFDWFKWTQARYCYDAVD